MPEWAGYLAYEMGAFSDALQMPFIEPAIPLAKFYRYDTAEKTSFAFSPQTLPTAKLAKPLLSEEVYCTLVQAIKEEIRDGNVYQVNLSHEIAWHAALDPFELFQQLAYLNPAPFSAYLNCGDFQIISSSPERLLQKKNNVLEARPIKGTAPRGKTPAEDEARKQALLHSVKDQAELLMITDLIRNDLGRVANSGSVITHPIVKLESYTNVHHLLSVIRATPLPHLHPVDILRNVFPGGSITGCPKLSAMQQIHRFEQRPRGIYTGSIGYFAPNGDFDFNIAIRTLLYQAPLLTCSLGGAIISDSHPKTEYEETLHKGQTIFRALNFLSD